MEKFARTVKGMAPGDIPCQICVRAVNKKPGLKEANFQVSIVLGCLQYKSYFTDIKFFLKLKNLASR